MDTSELTAERKRDSAQPQVANQQNWRVVSSHLVSGRTQIRVYSDTAPDATFTPTEATLEDVYFMKLNRTLH